MFDTTSLSRAPQSAESRQENSAYAGPERRHAGASMARWLSMTLDEVDYGLLLLDGEGLLLQANRAAMVELDAMHPVQLVGRVLRAREPYDVAALHDAMSAAAKRGLRRLLTLGAEHQRVSVAVLPMCVAATGNPGVVLMMLGKRELREALTLQCFASAHALTGAEARVLEALCRGLSPLETAATFGVGIATVRSQIGAVRQKTGAESIRALLDMVAKLPPMTGIVRPALTAVTMAGCRSRDQPLPT